MSPDEPDPDNEALRQRRMAKARRTPPSGQPAPEPPAKKPPTPVPVPPDEPSSASYSYHVAPSTIDVGALPRPKATEPSGDGGAGSTTGPRRPSSWLLTLGTICLGLFVAANIGGGSTKSVPRPPPTTPASTPTVPPPTTPASTPNVPPPTTPTNHPHTTPPQPLKPVWEKHVLLTYNQSYSLDSFPLSRETPNGFDVTTKPGPPGQSLTPEESGNISEWQGQGAPSRQGCRDSVGSGGTDHVHLGSPGVSIGGWICAKTISGLVVRLRYEGGSLYGGYHFAVTVWPG
jgi:hypothetical protein